MYTIGTHMSIAGGLAKTAENVVKMNADTMQIFSRNPRGSSYKTYLPEEIERFQSDFRIVANFFVKKRKNKDYIPDDPTEIKHVDEALKLLQVMTGDDRYKEMFKKKKEVHSMCDVAERLEKMGIAKGIELGREEEKKASRVEFILRVLEMKGGVDEKTRKRIEEEPDVDLLDIWFTKALKANTVQEFEQALD